MGIEALKEQARGHEQAEEWDKALALYTQAIERQSDDEHADLGLFNRAGDLSTRVGNLEGAQKHYEKAVKLYLESELPNNAIAILKKILRNMPYRTDVYLQMGKIRAGQGFLVDARENFLKYAEIMQQEDNLAEALRALVEFAGLAPDDVDIQLMVASQLHANERSEEAVGLLVDAYSHHLRGGRDQGAQVIQERIHEMDPTVVLPAHVDDYDGFETTVLTDDHLDSPAEDVDAPAGMTSGMEIEATSLAEPAADQPAPAVLDAAAGELEELTLDDDMASDGFDELAGIEWADDEAEAAPASPTPFDLEAVVAENDAAALESGSADLELDGSVELEDAAHELEDFAASTAANDVFGEVDGDIDLSEEDFQADVSNSDPADDAFGSVADPDDIVEDEPSAGGSFDLEASSDDVLEGWATPADEGDSVEVADDLAAAWNGASLDLADESAEGAALDEALILPEGEAEATEAESASLAAELEDSATEVGGLELSTPWLEDGSEGDELSADGDFSEDVLEDAWLTADDPAEAELDVEPGVTLEAAAEPAPREETEPEDLGWSPDTPEDEAPVEDPEVWLDLASQFQQAGDSEQARTALTEAHLAFSERLDFERASAAVASLIALEPESIEHHRRRIEYLDRTGDEAGRLAAHLELAELLDRTGESAEARSEYEKILELDPSNRIAHNYLGVVDEVSPETATEPPIESGYIDLGSMVIDRVEKTTRWTVEAEEPATEEDFDFREMLSQFKQKVAEHVDVGDVRAHYDLGTAYREMGLMDEAISEFQLALRADERNLATYEMLGQCFMEKGQPEFAIRSLGKAANLPHDVEDELLGIYYYLGRAHEELGQRDEAVEFYEKVFALDINFQDVTERLRSLR